MTPSAWLELPRARPFYEAILDREASCAWRAEDVILLIAGECDLVKLETPNRYGYEGPTQIGPNELRALGWNVAAMGAFCKAAPEVQIEFAGRYFQGWRRRLGIAEWTSAGHLWAANLAPAHLADQHGIVYGAIAHAAAYRANRWLDLDRDGIITRDELTAALVEKAIPRTAGRYELAIRNLEAVRASRPSYPPPPDLRNLTLSEPDFGRDDGPPDAA